LGIGSGVVVVGGLVETAADDEGFSDVLSDAESVDVCVHPTPKISTTTSMLRRISFPHTLQEAAAVLAALVESSA
jgi:hypothetical protein